jgi:hypothetical protein
VFFGRIEIHCAGDRLIAADSASFVNDVNELGYQGVRRLTGE